MSFEAALGPTGGSEVSGGLDTRPARSEVPSPGRWIRSGRKTASSVLHDCASLDWPTGPDPTPSGSGPRADCGQKQELGGRTGSRGIDTPWPVTEEAVFRIG